MPDTTHILKQVAELAADRRDFRLIEEESGGLFRLEFAALGIWVTLETEKGSKYDEWAAADGLRLITVTKEDVEAGARYIYEKITAMIETIERKSSN